MVVAFLAQGFEESELVVPFDMMRRAKIDIQLVAIGEDICVTSARGITIKADVVEKDFVLSKRCEMIFLPGGMPGTTNLEKSQTVLDSLQKAKKAGIFITAICAAPGILYRQGLLEGKKATIYPDLKDSLPQDIYVDTPVCDSGTIITAKSCGVAFEYGLLLCEKLACIDARTKVENSICKTN